MSDRPDPINDTVVRTLVRFTPSASLNRDELLFRAGRASAPNGQWWKWATAVLLMTQMTTLATWLWPVSKVEVSSDSIVSPDTSREPAEESPGYLPPESYGALARTAIRDGLPRSRPVSDMPPDGPALSIASTRRGISLD